MVVSAVRGGIDMAYGYICPYCGGALIRVSINDACGEYWYDECFDCGWCGEEHFSPNYYHDDPDREWDERE